MRKMNVRITSMIPGHQFVHYEEYKTAKELFKYAYSQVRLFAQKNGEYSFSVCELGTGKRVLWLHGFKSSFGYYVVCADSGQGYRELYRLPLA